MVRLRLARLGRRNRPFYRLHAIEKRNRRNGAVLEQLGWYDPVASDPEKQLNFNAERIAHWLSKGAQPSETVTDLLAKNDMLPEKLKAKWEADRTIARNRVDAKKSVAMAEAAVAALGALAGDSEADLASFVSDANDALKAAKDNAAKGQVEPALEAGAKAESALAAAKKADEDHKAAEAKKKAEEEAAAAAAAEAEAESGDSAEGGDEAPAE